MKKPVKPVHHGVIDYLFGAIQVFVPALVGVNKRASAHYQALGAGFAAMNAMTRTPVSVKPVLTFKEHQKADLAFLAGLTALTGLSFVMKDKKALLFHTLMMAAAYTHYFLTDYNAVVDKENKLNEVQPALL